MKRRTIITSVLVIVLCLGLISGSTFALFTSESSVNIAVTSGKVNIKASLDALKLYSADATLTEGDKVDKINPLDKTGTIKPTDPQGAFAGTYYYRDQTSEKEFLNGGTAAIENGELKITKITPGDKVTTNITITNDSNVDIQYRVKVNVLSGLKLYEGLVVKVDGLSLKGVQKVSNWTYKTIPANETEKTIATIPVEVYLPLDAGNEYQDLSTSMQITVEAVQGNAKTTNETLAQAINVEKPVANTASLQGQVITDNDQLVEVSVPAEAFGDEIPNTTTSLSVKIEPQDTTYNLVLTSTQASQSYDLEVLVKTKVGTEDPTTEKYNANNDASATALKIKMFVGTGLTGVKLYHKTTSLTAVATLSAVDDLNEYYYDSTEGYITLMTNSFSEYTVVYNKDIAVEKNNTITIYTPTEDANVYEDAEGNSVQITVDENNEVSVDTNGVAYIVKPTGTVFYNTLGAAIEEANASETAVTISIMKDIQQSGALVISNSMTIDGVNHTITTEKTATSGNMAAFDICDTSSNYPITVNVNDLTINSTKYARVFLLNGDYCTYDNTNILNIDNLKITTDGQALYSNGPSTINARNCDIKHEGQYLAGKDPVYYSAIIVGYNGTINIYDSKVSSFGNGAATFPSGGTVNVYNTEITAFDDLVDASTGYLFWARHEKSYDTCEYKDLCGSAIINVYSGVFEGPYRITHDGLTSANRIAAINIYGGTFSHDPTVYVPTTGYVVNYANEKYTVQSTLNILADQLKAAGYKDVSINENEKYVLGTFTDDVVYRFYSLEESYVEDPKNYNGFAGNDVEIDTTVYYVGKLVPVTGIVQSGFANQSTITKLVITKDLTDTYKALSGNTTITTVEYVKGVKTVTNRFFFNSSVQNVLLSDTITTIEDWAFYTSNITSLVVPEACTYIGYKAFDGCTTITTLDIKGSPVIYNWAGRGATNLKTIIIRGANAKVDLVHAPSNQPVGDYVFNNVGQTTNPHYNDGMKIYVANSTVGSLFAKEIYAGADVVVMENPTTFIPNN